MFNLRQLIRPLVPVAVVLLLCVFSAPEAQANNGSTPASTQTTTPVTRQQDTKKAQPTPKKPVQKSVFDAEVLESPLSYFKNAFSPDEDDDSSDLTSHSSTIVITIKALVASLLSTII